LILVAVATIVSLACAIASARRLVFAMTPIALDPKMLSDAAKGAPLDVVTRAISRNESATWEKNLLAAMAVEGPTRTGEINEQLLEAEWLAQRWARVPRVCASVATSIGFLLATLALRQGLLDPNTAGIDQLIVRSVNVLAIGIAGATFCVAVHLRAGKEAKKRMAEVDALVESLEKAPTK